MTSFTYAGIGSRKTPKRIRELMEELARELRMLGYRLRSGGAPGADRAFALGAGADSDIFLPTIMFPAETFGGTIFGTPADWTYAIAKDAHPAWGRVRPEDKLLHQRNVHQILGHDGQTLSAFVVCWTPDGCASGETTRATGGTGQALRIAAKRGVPIFNLAVEGHAAAALEFAWRLSGQGETQATDAGTTDLMGYLSAVAAEMLEVQPAVARAGLQAAHEAFEPGRALQPAARRAAAVWFPERDQGAQVALEVLSYAATRARAFRAAEAAPVPDDLVDVVVRAYGGRVSRTAAAVGLHVVADAFDGTGFGDADAWAENAREAAREWGLYSGRGARPGWPVEMQATTVLRRVAAAAM